MLKVDSLRTRSARLSAGALGAAVVAALVAGCASTSAPVVANTPGCLDDAAVNRLVADYNARRPAADLPANLTAADAHCTRSKFQQRLAGQAGRLVGYKAGLTNPAVQKRFNTDQPVWGALYTDMLRDSGATVDAATRLGQLVAERAKAAGITQVVFDRGGFAYHGRVKALADRLTREHRDLESRWKKLEPGLKRVAKGQDSDLDTTALAELVAMYTAHARFEEAEYLPLAHTILSRGRHSMEALALALHLRHSPAVVGYI